MMTQIEMEAYRAVINYCRENGSKHTADLKNEYIRETSKDILCAMISSSSERYKDDTEEAMAQKAVNLAQILSREFF